MWKITYRVHNRTVYYSTDGGYNSPALDVQVQPLDTRSAEMIAHALNQAFEAGQKNAYTKVLAYVGSQEKK